MATYRIEWKASALRELKRIDRQDVPRIVAAVGTLSDNPFPTGVRKLQGTENTYRMRVGDYRVLYEVYHSSICIQIIRVRHRKDAYRG
jgi:mRNA interferase RelE/StbE